jgi:hypothetical protein
MSRPQKIPLSSVQNRVEEKWLQLCRKAAVEKDSAKLMNFVQEVNDLLDQKESQLKPRQTSHSRRAG